jgi:GTP-binding protein
LIDARRGVLDLDRDVMRLLDDAAVSFAVVLTKSDKLTPDELAATLAVVDSEARKYTAAFPEISATSALRHAGLDPMKVQLAALAEH